MKPRSLYAAGSNGCGQLGLGHTNDVHKFTILGYLHPVSVASIVGGGNHTLILDLDGQILSAGSNQHFQLDRSDDPTLFRPVDSMQGPFKLIAAGWAFSVAVNSKDYVFTVGAGPNGELGTLATTHNEFTRVFVPEPGVKVESIDAGPFHCVLSLSSGDVYGWGRSRHGQLGNTREKFVGEPRLVVSKDLNKGVPQVRCGKDFTVLKYNDHFEVLGKFDYEIPFQSMSDPVDICCGWSSVHLLTKESRIVSFGNNSHGQRDSPDGFIDSMAFGSEHGIAIRRSDSPEATVSTWGWGEHGNCPQCPDGFNMHRTRVYAGCATSFIRLN